MENHKKIRENVRGTFKKLEHRGINRFLVFLILMTIILFSLSYLEKNNIVPLPSWLSKIVLDAIIIVGSYLVATAIIKFTINRVSRLFDEKEGIEQKIILTKFYTIFIYILATIVVLWEIGVTIQNITLIIGLFATGFAFAIRDVISSYIIWFMLLTKKPFRIGDYIKIGDDEGEVLHIGTFYVLLDNSPEKYDDYTRIPNLLFIQKPIHNFGRGEINWQTKIPLQNPQKDFEERIKRIQEKAGKILGTTPKVSLDVSGDKIYMVINFNSSWQKKKILENQLLNIMISEMV